MAKEKEHINLAFIGHVDHGKSTLVGRLLYDLGYIDEKDLGEGEDKFRVVMDKLEEERERGVTIDLAHTKFETDNYEFTIVDCPGHRYFIMNMITGASLADAAVVVVAADDGVMPQTKEHAFLARTLGIDQIIVAINKMDLVDYDQNRYEEVKQEVAELLKTIGYNVDEIPFIPISAFKGDNVVEKSDNMPWYDGPTLVEALDELEPPEKPIDKPLRIPVQDVYSITGVGTVAVGRVETGVLEVGDTVRFEPVYTATGGRKGEGEVRSIEMHHEPLERAEPGDNIGFNVKGVGKNDISRGDVACHPDEPATVVTPKDTFVAQIVVLQHPSAITVGYTPVFHCHTAQVACKFEELLEKIDPATGEVIEENPDFLRTGEAGKVRVRPTKPMVVEEVQEIPQLGRFAIRDMGQTVAAGMCIKVEKEEE
jgi:elongation factor 1-alpha